MSRSPVVRVLQHVAEEGPGRIEKALARRGIDVAVTRIDRGEPVPADLAGASGLVVMGGPMGVYEGDRYPHLTLEERLIERALGAGVPLLGVCLGSQLLASVLGARVYAGPSKEIGWFSVTLGEAASTDPLFGGLPATFDALHWHGDVFDLPDGATHLARSSKTRNQAFRWGERAYGLLFHLEATAEQVSGMASAFAGELASAGVDAARLVAESAEAARRVAPIGDGVFARWAALISS